MKYIEIPALSHLSQTLCHDGPECSVHTRIEAYSCKNVKRDKRLFRSLETSYQDEVSHSPPIPSWLALDHEAEMTPFGPIDKHASRKTLYLLISTLNIAFPDYEFSDVRPGHFNKEESGASVLNALSTTLVSPSSAGLTAPRTYSSYPPTSSDFFPSSLPTSSSPHNSMRHSPYAPPPIVTGTHPTVFRIIDQVIGLQDCEVFSYSPEIEFDPHANDDESEDDATQSPDPDDDSAEEDDPFVFDHYDVDESNSSGNLGPPSGDSSAHHISPSVPFAGGRIRNRALLWSSHWFFLNRKLKRILFVSIWARSNGISGMLQREDDELSLMGYLPDDIPPNSERFLGWEGASGAGARALGLVVTASA